ncbi:uncharacterized protein TNCV_2927131 [Trichonephila clavipes]|nr:uncharacterized protein TNCV_2927131 [Trichonephila clavipes]
MSHKIKKSRLLLKRIHFFLTGVLNTKIIEVIHICQTLSNAKTSFVELDFQQKFVVVVSFPKGRNESCQSLRPVGLLHAIWKPHISTPPQFRHGTGGKENILQPPAPVVSAATAHKTFGPTDLTSTCSRVYTEGIWGHRASNRGPLVWSPML